ncbi:hypothetical protein [Gracilinema caldarium]|uniref:Uncharacterized protein n=1 Tax=Gracilinema caldarium (strain ATCC 51460 / DSM 7334 / H1) TaxID=744872 RepID=F8F4C8_GRAC1|nr:hypothetical protein [Gracilinema caldarium]AEJ20575.1 hypothetical protein Spica_2470 [Gracilinema caldarium DSM 7334]
MKRSVLLTGLLIIIILLDSCGSMPVPGVSVNIPGPNLSGAAATASSSEVMDFKKDEVLCLSPQDQSNNGRFYLARVITPASKETKNQAEVLFIEDGVKGWTSKVILTRKVEKADLTIGTLVFYPDGWQMHEKMSQDQYRFATWRLGRITNNDELFKNLIEIAGASYYYSVIRIPLEKIE